MKLAKPCPVCKEKWKAEFEEEEEEWVFWNAVDVDGVVSCLSIRLEERPLILLSH